MDTSSSSTRKQNRIKVTIRCRPIIKSEVEEYNGYNIPIVNTTQEPSGQGIVSLTQASGKQRQFHYDNVFGPESIQDSIFETVAQPVINDFLEGFNGTIFAYGQTGTGKTYTMGVLEFVNDEHAGIIPRTISKIFEYVGEVSRSKNRDRAEVRITLSFLQLYRETVQDLLAPLGVSTDGRKQNDILIEESLTIREDPLRGG